jgi:hypothetical protein
LMRGERIGTALDFFNLRFAALATELTNYLNDLEFGAEANSAYLASIWTAHNDARSYMVVGDPAVRLPLIETGEDPIRPSLIADVRIPSASTPSDLARSGVAAKVEDPPSDSVSHPSVQPLRFGSAITVPVPEPRLSETTSSSDRFLTSSGLESVSGTDLGYYLLAFDPVGRERTDSPAGLISNQILMALQKEPITDVIIFSHGWRGDVPAAREQYQGWLKTMAGCGADRIAIGQRRSAFRPLLIGVHWPSEPWGDERLDTSFSFVTDDETAAAHWVDEYAQALGDTPRIRAAIESVLAAVENAEVDGGDSAGGLPSELLAAYKDLDIAVGLPKQGIAGAPGADWDRFDPEVIFQIFRDEPVGADVESFGIGSKLRDSLLAPLRMMSFWKMKDRARLIGEQSVNPLLAKMQRAVGTRDVRFHLAGHSFGCIVASAAVAGLPGTAPLPRPIDSLSLLQGALSLWAYCSKQPYGSGEPGYFHRIISQGVIRGPIVTSQSDYDTAVRVLYPRAAQVAGHVAFAPVGLPKYGAIGTFGIQGPGLNISNVKMLPVDQNYPLHGGQIYNVDGTSYINQGGGLSGAHSDIRRPEVAHLVWQAILPE